MYTSFFGFKEKPFKLVPDPEYLFLSRCHEEALAHLTYAVNHGDGFVLITGEVGTGKTTLCRAFLDSLDNSVEVAYIFNPKMDASQLLKAINDDFSIDSGNENIKNLIDALNSFLLEEKTRGRQVLILIDEAQNLSDEVLEQLRLLSNLETNREKLLQIILVGQPELLDKLASHELRQLGQRINITSRLAPLTAQETEAYIQHRIKRARQLPGDIFDRSACRRIHAYAGGIPRLINIACDRALLTAFSLNRFRVTATIARQAINELRDHSGVRPRAVRYRLAMLFAVFILLAAAAMYYPTWQQTPANTSSEPLNPIVGNSPPTVEASSLPAGQLPSQLPPANGEPGATTASPPGTNADNIVDIEKPVPDALRVPAQESGQDQALAIMSLAVHPAATEPPATFSSSPPPVAVAGALPQPAFQPTPAETLQSLLPAMDPKRSRTEAVSLVLDLWQPGFNLLVTTELISNDAFYFQNAAQQNGLQVSRVTDLALLKKLAMPAILPMKLPGTSTLYYLVYNGIEQGRIILSGGWPQHRLTLDHDAFLAGWQGESYIIWRNFYNISGTLQHGMTNQSVHALKLLLRDTGFTMLDSGPVFTDELLSIIQKIQREYGLVDDGMVGPLTKIALYRNYQTLPIPRLMNSVPATGGPGQ